MKISEFAELNNVTTKMLRHYDEIGLLKPSSIDSLTGYRSYDLSQCSYLNWIIILKDLDFSLLEIKETLSGPISNDILIKKLVSKRISISSGLNIQIQKKLQIDKLIDILKKEDFSMDKTIDLLSIEQKSVHDIKKNMANMEMFLEEALDISDQCSADNAVGVLRLDLWHFKEINDNYGFDVGDNVIVACYEIIKSNVEKINNPSAIGRAHGDEFVIFCKANKTDLAALAQNIIKDFNEYDFTKTGCTRQIGVYIGGVTSNEHTLQKIRKMIEDTHEALNQARYNGVNSIIIVD